MERQLVVWCPGLLEQQEHGREARAFANVLRAVGEFSPRIEVLRPGACSLCTRGPSRYFGGDEALANLLARALASLSPGGEPSPWSSGVTTGIGIGVADGLFAASLAARRALEDPGKAPVLVEPGGTSRFLSPWPVSVLDRPELADLLCRLGIRTLGAFAELPARHVLARFGADGAACRAVAAGSQGELPGLCTVPRSPRRASAGVVVPAVPDARSRQLGFFGGSSGAEARADEAIEAVQLLLHPEAVVRGRLSGGRGPLERARLVPWGGRQGVITWQTAIAGRSSGGDHPTASVDPFRSGTEYEVFPRKRLSIQSGVNNTNSQEMLPRRRPGRLSNKQDPPLPGGAPWPGQVPAPSPAIVPTKKLPAELVDVGGRPIEVDTRGIVSDVPARVSVGGEPWSEIAAWAGPWPSEERWWSRSRSRQARMQVVTTSGAAYLLTCKSGWWVEGIYD